MNVSFIRLVIQTHGKVPEFTWHILQNLNRHGISLSIHWVFLFTAWSLWECLSLAISLFCLRIVHFVSDPCHCFQRLGCHDWNCVGLIWNTVHVHFTENTLLLSFQRRLSFLYDPWWLISCPQHRSRLWSFEFSSSDQHEVSQLSLICDSSVPWFAPFLDRTMPSQSEFDQNLPVLTCTILPGSCLRAFHSQKINIDPIWRRHLGRRHSVNF